jgi:outer membrane protein
MPALWATMVAPTIVLLMTIFHYIHNNTEGDMKKLLVAILAMMVFLPAAATAETKIGYVDTQQVFDVAKLGKKYKGILQEYFSARKKILDADADEIRRLEEEYRKQASVMKENARKEKEEGISRKIADFQKKQGEFNEEVGKKNDELSKEFDQMLMVVLKDIAKKGKFTLVLNKLITLGPRAEVPVILYAEEGIEVTDKVVAEMDKKFGDK